LDVAARRLKDREKEKEKKKKKGVIIEIMKEKKIEKEIIIEIEKEKENIININSIQVTILGI
jgi:hypothetical protein